MPFLLPALLALQFALPPAIADAQPIMPAADFALHLTPTARLNPGGSTHFDLFIDATRPIVFSLKLEGIPPAVRPDIPKLTPGINTITLSCPPDTPRGTYDVRVTVLDGTTQQSQNFALDITPATP